MDKPWKVISAFVGVFIAGAVFGGVFTLRASAKRFSGDVELAQRPRGEPVVPPQRPPAQAQVGSQSGPQQPPRGNPITPTLMRTFTRRLNLTSEQKEQIGKIVSRAGEDYLRLRQEHFADTQRVTERMYADVSGFLTLEQRVELEAMRRQVQERLQAGREKKADGAQPDGRGAIPPSAARPPAGPRPPTDR